MDFDLALENAFLKQERTVLLPPKKPVIPPLELTKETTVNDAVTGFLDFLIVKGQPFIVYADYSDSYRVRMKTCLRNRWWPVGVHPLSTDEAYFSALSVGPKGRPHVAYVDRHANYDLSLMRYQQPQWELLAHPFRNSQGFSDLILKHSQNGTIYIGGLEKLNASTILRIFRLAKNGWNELLLPLPNKSSVDSFDMAIKKNMLYIAYTLSKSNHYSIHISTFKKDHWEDIGSANVSEKFVGNIQLDFFRQAPILTYINFDDYLSAHKISALRFVQNKWQLLGEKYFNPGRAIKPSLASDRGLSYVSYIDKRDQKIRVLRYSHGSWKAVAPDVETPGRAIDQKLAVYNSIPCVAYIDEADHRRIKAMPIR